MNTILKIRILALLLTIILAPIYSQNKIKIACIGNSITYGAGIINQEKNSYPSQLQNYLGDNFEVRNFGVSGRTAMKRADYPYVNTNNYKESIEYNPDILFIKLGTNDSKGWNMKYYEDFEQDYKSILEPYRNQNPNIRIILITPLRSYLDNPDNIYNPRIREKITPVIEKIAYEENLEIFDGYSLTEDKCRFEIMPDKLHPSSIGAGVIAMNLDRYLSIERDPNFDIFKNIDSSSDFNFHGFKGKNISHGDLELKIVQPKITNKKHSWVIRARFWGHEPQLDIKLLELGYHIVYCNVENLYGAPIAVEKWNKLYKLSKSLGLNKKVTLEGMSRGGLIVYNWAIKNIDKISSIYADAPVMDIKSWPLGWGESKGSDNDKKNIIKVYGFDSEEKIKQYNRNPIDHAKHLAKSKIPIIHVIGDADDVVPINENTNIFQQRLKQYGGDMKIISKKNIGHHPHSLSAPEEILKFILKADGLYENYCAKPVPGNEFRSAAGWKSGSEWNLVSEEISNVLSNKKVDILLLGNSIIQRFATKDRILVTNPIDEDVVSSFFEGKTWESAGISGDKTQNLLWRIKNGNYSKSNPKYVAIAIGVNNLVTSNDDEMSIYNGIIEIVNAALDEFKESNIILLGLLPTGVSEEKLTSYHQIQSRLKKTKFNKRVTYINPTQYFMNESGELKYDLYSNDLIHLKIDGYKQLCSLIKSAID